MIHLLDGLALLVTVGALIAAVVCLAATGAPHVALAVLLDLLMAAGLLRLAGDPTVQRTVTAAAVVAVRHLVVLGLRLMSSPAEGRLSRGRPFAGSGGRRAPGRTSRV